MADILGKLESYAKAKTKDALANIAGDVVGRIGSELGLGRKLTNALSGLAESLISGSGVSFAVTQSISSTKLDSILAKSFEDFTGFSGKCPERAAAADLSAGRQPNAKDATNFYNFVAPQGVMEKAKGDEAMAGGVKSLSNYDPNERYYMNIRFYRYTSDSLFKQSSNEPLITVKFPIPAELVDNQGSDYDTASMKTVGDITKQSNPTGFGKGSAVAAAMRLGGVAVDNLIPGGTFGQGAGSLGIDSDTIMNAIEQSYGVAPNPNPAVLFKGPRLREFSFNWILHPRDPNESKNVRNIIKLLKTYALPAPTFGADTGLLSYPPVAMLNFYPWDEKGSGIYGWGEDSPIRIKRCFISNVTANYAPNGIPSFFAGTNDPVVISLSIQLKEIEFFTQGDFYGYGGTSDINAGGVGKQFESLTGKIIDATKGYAAPEPPASPDGN